MNKMERNEKNNCYFTKGELCITPSRRNKCYEILQLHPDALNDAIYIFDCPNQDEYSHLKTSPLTQNLGDKFCELGFERSVR